MQRDIKLIGLDLDGTTLNSQKQLTARVAATIQKAGEAGVLVLPATGRALAGIPAEVLQIPGIRYALCANGAKVYELASGKTLVENCFTRETALDILDALGSKDNMPAVFIDGKVYKGQRDFEGFETLYDANTLNYVRISRHTVPDLHQFVKENPRPVEKVTVIFTSMEARNAAKEMLAARGDCEVSSSMPGNLEVNAAGVNKGESLLQLGRLLGFSRSQVMAVGDGDNDLQMLQAVGFGVAMANSTPAVLKAADFITLSCDEDGVAAVIEQLLPPLGRA